MDSSSSCSIEYKTAFFALVKNASVKRKDRREGEKWRVSLGRDTKKLFLLSFFSLVSFPLSLISALLLGGRKLISPAPSLLSLPPLPLVILYL